MSRPSLDSCASYEERIAEAARWNQWAWEQRANAAHQESGWSRLVRRVASLPTRWRRPDPAHS